MSELDRLVGAQRDLYQLMSDISEDVYAAGWMHGTEWVLWDALLSWRTTGEAYWGRGEYRSNLADYMPAVDALQRACCGWVWWLDGMQYVQEERWLRLVNLRSRTWFDNPRDDNEVLDRIERSPSVPDTKEGS